MTRARKFRALQKACETAWKDWDEVNDDSGGPWLSHHWIAVVEAERDLLCYCLGQSVRDINLCLAKIKSLKEQAA